MTTKLSTESSWAINFGAYSLPTPKYEDTTATRCQIGKNQRRGDSIINDSPVRMVERLIMMSILSGGDTRKTGREPNIQT